MAKKKSKKCPGRGLWFLCFIVFGSFGFAAIIQGILNQISQGFNYGFFAYLLGMVAIAGAKMAKAKFMKC